MLLLRLHRSLRLVSYSHLQRSRIYRYSSAAPKYTLNRPMAPDQAPTAPAAATSASESAQTQAGGGTPSGTHKDPVTGEMISKQCVFSIYSPLLWY